MSAHIQDTAIPRLGDRLEALGRSLGEREAVHGEALQRARDCAAGLRDHVAAALDRFHAASEKAGAPHLRVEVGEIRVDDKHLRAVEFELCRGRHRAIVTAKSRGEVTLVGPFRAGKAKSRGEVTLVGPFRAGKVEGPCKSFPLEAQEELHLALGEFLEQFVEEAATP
jgi:hypothetical protein